MTIIDFIPRTAIWMPVALALITSAGCSSGKRFAYLPPITEEKDNKDISQPEFKEVDLYEDALENIAGRPIKDFGNLSGHLRKLANKHKQAKNVNALDEVPNSSWFTNRHAAKRMSIAELVRGPDRGTGPDTTGPFTVIGAKLAGVSPGFIIKDQRGDVYFIKFDLKGYPQLNTAPEVISTKFVYACGYNTPENYISKLDPRQLKIKEGLTTKNRWLRNIPMTSAFLQDILARAEQNADGTYRIVASKRLSGSAIGPFKYAGTRSDDPNDYIPHNYRRELRGYKVVAAWLNNTDSKSNNTLDMYVEEDGKHFVKHYMIDFATSLGAGGRGPGATDRGKRGAADFGHMLLKTLSLGLWVEPWEKKLGTVISPSVGYFDSELFDPADYAFIIPNPAFTDATELDGFWGAKLVMSFSDSDIRAIVGTGQFNNKSDEEYIIKTLIERRDKIGRYWYGKVNPLDTFRLVAGNAHLNIAFEDLAANAGFTDKSQTSYRYKLRYHGKDLTKYYFSKANPRLPLTDEIYAAITNIVKGNPSPGADDKVFSFRVETKRHTSDSYGKYVDVYFYYPGSTDGEGQIIALQREN